MKLNVGCGGVYKRGYLNVDAFDTTVADQTMSAVDLALEDNTAERIECVQLIEHLGLPGGIYTLSECFRVLQPEGTLLVETPDIMRSFQQYIHGRRETRKNILPWIYGIETPGMQHKFCFPADLLKEMITKIGFTKVKTKYFSRDDYEPVLQVTCSKPKEDSVSQCIALYRKKLIKEHVVDFHNQLLSLEQEIVIDFFSSKLRLCKKQKFDSFLGEITREGAVSSPTMTVLFFDALVDKQIIPAEKAKEYRHVLQHLISLDFPSILCFGIREIPDFIGEQSRLVDTIRALGAKSVNTLLNPTRRSRALKSMIETKQKIKPYDTLPLFSEKMLLQKAHRFFQRGAKAFVLAKYHEAIDFFLLSICFYRNQILSYWNLGRLYSLVNNNEQSKKYYEITFDLLRHIKHGSKAMIQQKLKREFTCPPTERPVDPLFSLSDLVS
jgi:predicted SAM-dependent methyltransferase